METRGTMSNGGRGGSRGEEGNRVLLRKEEGVDAGGNNGASELMRNGFGFRKEEVTLPDGDVEREVWDLASGRRSRPAY